MQVSDLIRQMAEADRRLRTGEPITSEMWLSYYHARRELLRRQLVSRKPRSELASALRWSAEHRD